MWQWHHRHAQHSFTCTACSCSLQHVVFHEAWRCLGVSVCCMKAYSRPLCIRPSITVGICNTPANTDCPPCNRPALWWVSAIHLQTQIAPPQVVSCCFVFANLLQTDASCRVSRRAAVLIQHSWRASLAVRNTAAVRIQAAWRRHQAQHQLWQSRQAACTIQVSTTTQTAVFEFCSMLGKAGLELRLHS